ncbi:MAG: OmpA family protein [Solitalea-like symbiont of Acarus siro]
MAVNIMETLKGFVSSDLLSKDESKFSENESSLKNAVDKIIPTIVGAFSNKNTDAGLMNKVSSFAQDLGSGKSNNDVLSDSLNNTNVQDKSASVLNNLFGDKFSSICESIASSSNVKTATVSGLMGSIVSLFTGHLSRESQSHGSGVSGIMSFLTQQKNQIVQLLPDSVTSTLGIDKKDYSNNYSYKVADASGNVKKVPYNKTNTEDNKKSPWGWILLLLLAALLGFFIWKSCGKTEVDTNAVSTPDTTATDTDVNTDTVEEGKVIDDTSALIDTGTVTVQEKWSYLGEVKSLDLPNGTSISVPEKGFEAQLLSYLKSNKALNKSVRFNSDKLTFPVNESSLDDDAKSQSNNIAAILKAYPKVKIEVGGYASSTGQEKLNKNLSMDRAKAVTDYIVSQGVDKSRVISKGYGENNPIASNKTEDGRAQNQRVSVKILNK